MENQEKVETILGISIMYIIIMSIFSFLNKICSYILTGTSAKQVIRILFYRNTLWVVVVIIVIAVLATYMKKNDLEVSFKIMNNSTVRLTTGLLIAADGLITLASVLPVIYASIVSAIQSSRLVGNLANNIIVKAIASNTILIVLLLGQIALGIYFIKYYSVKGKIQDGKN